MKEIYFLLGIIFSSILFVILDEVYHSSAVELQKSYLNAVKECEKELPRNDYCDFIVIPRSDIDKLESQQNETN